MKGCKHRKGSHLLELQGAALLCILVVLCCELPTLPYKGTHSSLQLLQLTVLLRLCIFSKLPVKTMYCMSNPSVMGAETISPKIPANGISECAAGALQEMAYIIE